MENPLLGQEPLPQFLQIRPEHVEPAVREVLTENRARIEELASLPIPTFATLIEPLQELQHRVSRTWSPVSHLNAVLNSDALRTGYNACLPLLSAYQTDLAQSEPLFQAYRTIADQERAALAPVQRQVIEHAMRDFRLAGVGLPAERKARFKSAMLELTQLQAKFEENVLDATNAWTWQVADPQQLRGLNDMLIEQARRRAHERGVAGWILTLDQPTYVAVVTDAESETLRRAFYEAWMTRASDCGPSAGRWDNSAGLEDILRRRHEAGAVVGSTRSRPAGRTASRKGCSSCTSSRARPAPRRWRNSPSSKRSPAASSLPGTSASMPSGCSVSVSRCPRSNCGRTSRCRGCSPDCSRSPSGCSVCASASAPVRRCGTRMCASSTSPASPARRSAAFIWTPTRAPTSAVARGWTSASAASTCAAERRCRLPTWCAISCRPHPGGRRCSRTTTCLPCSTSSATACTIC